MFNKRDFEVFNDDSLDGRLSLIQQQLDPKFEEFGEQLLQKIEEEYQDKFYMKIAKHQRRTKNPPPDTWLAINQNHRGYKKTPHMELGLWPDRYFITLSFLADINKRTEYYPFLKEWQQIINNDGWNVSNDHTQPGLKTGLEYTNCLEHYQKVKSSDLVIGFDLMKDSDIVRNGDYDNLLFDKFIKLSDLMVKINKEVIN